LEKSSAIITTGVSHVAEQGFNEILHVRNKYRSRFDMKQTGENAIRLKLTNLQTIQKNLQIKRQGHFTQYLEPSTVGNEKHFISKCNWIRFGCSFFFSK